MPSTLSACDGGRVDGFRNCEQFTGAESVAVFIDALHEVFAENREPEPILHRGQPQRQTLTLLDDGRRVKAGNVTIPANHDIPQCGDVVVDVIDELREQPSFSRQLLLPSLDLASGDSNDSGGWPDSFWNDDLGDYEEIDVSGQLAEHLADGEVAVLMEAGSESLRYVTGSAVAVNNRGENVEVYVESIYEAPGIWAIPSHAPNTEPITCRHEPSRKMIHGGLTISEKPHISQWTPTTRIITTGQTRQNPTPSPYCRWWVP